MKRFLILFLCIVSLQLPRIFAQEVAQKDIDEMSAQVFAKQQDLKSKQQELEQQITKQKEVVEQAPGDQKDEESTLNALQIASNRAAMSITSLGDYLDQVNKGEVTVEDQAAAQNAIDNANNAIKIIDEVLKSEYLPSAPTQEQTEQEAQAQIEKLSLWDTFKLNIQSVFAQTRAALAGFFGNKEAAAAAHKDLLGIYNQLKDYGNKAKSAGQLAGLYKELGDFGNAIQMQAARLDALINSDAHPVEKISAAGDAMSDLLSLMAELDKGQLELTDKDIQAMNNIYAGIGDFLGDFGYKINEVSAYTTLGVKPDARVYEIIRAYNDTVKIYTPFAESTNPELQEGGKEGLEKLKKAVTELLGPDLENPDLATKAAYDKKSIIKRGFNIIEMTPDEKKAFDDKKSEEAKAAGQAATGILGG